MTGMGTPKWTVERDDDGVAVLRQSGKATYPLALKEGTNIRDGFVEVRFKPISGSEDRAGGIVWRARDANNYYVVRANALEDNVRLYKVVKGNRLQFAGANIKVPSGIWQDLRLVVRGNRFEVFFEGKSLYSATDTTFSGAGRVALWTKADSVTWFDDLRIAPL
jgi:hypothetical protein